MDARTQYPDEPWMWRPEWASGRIPGSTRSAMWAAWVMTIALLGFSIPLLRVLPGEIRDGNPGAWLGLLFPLAAAGGLIWALRATFRRRRFGTTYLELDTLPGVIGGTLSGALQLSTDLRPAAGFELRLRCVRRRRGRGRSASSEETTTWESRLKVDVSKLQLGPGGARVPFSFTIPYTSDPSTPPENADERVSWKLDAHAPASGVAFHTEFEVPVFRTEQSSRAVTAHDEPPPEPIALGGDDYEMPGSKVRIRRLGGNTMEFWFGPARHKSAAASLSLVTAIFGIGLAALASQGGPWFMMLPLGLVVLFCVWAALALWLGATRVRVDPAGIAIRRGLFGLGRSKFVAAESVQQISVERGMVANGSLYYDLVVREKRGNGVEKRHKAGSSIADPRAAEGIAAAMRTALGTGSLG